MAEPLCTERIVWMSMTAKLRAAEGSASNWDKQVAQALAELAERRGTDSGGTEHG